MPSYILGGQFSSLSGGFSQKSPIGFINTTKYFTWERTVLMECWRRRCSESLPSNWARFQRKRPWGTCLGSGGESSCFPHPPPQVERGCSGLVSEGQGKHLWNDVDLETSLDYKRAPSAREGEGFFPTRTNQTRGAGAVEAGEEVTCQSLKTRLRVLHFGTCFLLLVMNLAELFPTRYRSPETFYNGMRQLCFGVALVH